MALWLWICGWPLCVPSKRGHLWWLSCCVDSTRSGEILVKDKDNFFLWSIDTFHITLHIQSKNPCEAQFMHQSPDTALCQVLVTQSCPTLWDPTDYSPPGYSVLGLLQARIQEWVVIPFSRGSSRPRDRTWVSCIASEPPGVLHQVFSF